MLVRSDEKVPIARLLTFLEHGERMAHDCARAQAALVPDAGARRFLFRQARQEAAHALVFQGAIAWLAPKHLGDTPFLPALEVYRKMLDDALARQDVLETFLAEQVILEGVIREEEADAARRAAEADRLAAQRTKRRADLLQAVWHGVSATGSASVSGLRWVAGGAGLFAGWV